MTTTEETTLLLGAHRGMSASARAEVEFLRTEVNGTGQMADGVRAASLARLRVAETAAEWHDGRARVLAQKLNEEAS